MSTADVVNTWFAERLACGAIARNTEAYNQAAGALPDLIQRLALDVAAPGTPAEPGKVEAKGDAPEAPAAAPDQGSPADKPGKS